MHAKNHLLRRVSSLLIRSFGKDASREVSVIPDASDQTINREVRVMGQDYLGNFYYERDKAPNRVKRWFLPENEDDWDKPIPPEWEAWLRYRRDDAPTCDEINLNIALAELKKLRAKELEIKEKLMLPAQSSSSLSDPSSKVNDGEGKKPAWPKYGDISGL